MNEGLVSAMRDIIDRMERDIANADDYLALVYIATSICKKYMKEHIQEVEE